MPDQAAHPAVVLTRRELSRGASVHACQPAVLPAFRQHHPGRHRVAQEAGSKTGPQTFLPGFFSADWASISPVMRKSTSTRNLPFGASTLDFDRVPGSGARGHS